MDQRAAAAALRQISRGVAALADALDESSPHGEAERQGALLRDWAARGLTQTETSALFRRYGYAPQTAGGWARGRWIEVREDGLRYLTERSHRWLAEQADDD